MMHEPPVQFSNVAFTHASGQGVLRDVSLVCEAGETVAILGRSGAGKSTLLRLVNRMLLPSSGRVCVQGQATTDWDPIRLRRRIGYVLQDAGLFPHMSVAENVAVVPNLEGWEIGRVQARTGELLEMVGLAPASYAARRPAELSGGQRQRVGLARALAVDPPILLMDEPFGALDPMTRAEVRAEFVRLKRQLRTTVLIVTHDVAEAFVLADRVAVMDGGELIAVDSPARLSRSDDPRVSALVRATSPERGHPE
jgi:osmoprotectant transport system ATP-binding protein